MLRSNGAILADPAASYASADKFSLRLAADYHFTKDVLGYSSLSRGYKSAVFNLLTYNPVANLPEEFGAYEVGLNSELLDRRVRGLAGQIVNGECRSAIARNRGSYRAVTAVDPSATT